jgi:glycosyltransferase involved in cell wall biosynthesis
LPTTLSIIIAGRNCSAVIHQCLAALEAQPEREQFEVIVADSSTDGTAAVIRQHFPWVHLRHFDRPLTLPELRGRALAVAQGDILAILDPYSIVAPDWTAELLKAHSERPEPVIGGSVELFQAEQQSLAAWTLYFNEYGMFMPPATAGPTPILPGSNISYKRPALGDLGRFETESFWKTFANWESEAAGQPLWLAPAVKVYLHKPIPLSAFFRSRFAHGRCFAGMRVAGAGRGQKLFRALTTPFLPALLWYRWAGVYWPKKRRRRQFLLTLPGQWLLFTNWAAGELWGYLFGPGQSCNKLYY